MKRFLGIVLSLGLLTGCYPQQPQQQQQSITVQQQDAVPGPVVVPRRSTNVIIDRHYVHPYPPHHYHPRPYPPRPYHPAPLPPHHDPHQCPPPAPPADGVGVHIRAGDTSIGVRTGRR